MVDFRKHEKPYDTLRKETLYGGKDSIMDRIPRPQIYQDLAEALGKTVFDGGELVWDLVASFYKRDITRKSTLLRGNHHVTYVNGVNRAADLANLGMWARFVPSTNPDALKRVSAEARLKVSNLTHQDVIAKALTLSRLLLGDELDYCHLLKLSVEYLHQGSQGLMFSRAYRSEEIDHLLSASDKMNSLPKEPYREAYGFYNFFDKVVKRYQDDLGTLVAWQCKGTSVAVRCLRPTKHDSYAIAALNSLESTQEEWIEGLKGYMNQSPSTVVRHNPDGSEISGIHTVTDVLDLCQFLYAFEFIPNRHPTGFEKFNEEQLKGFTFSPLIDFDNHSAYEKQRDNVNAICDGLSDIGIQGISLCGTGTEGMGAHASFYQLYPELLVLPPRAERFAAYIKTPLPKIWLHSLNTSLEIMLLKIIAERNLDVGINPSDPREAACETIAEPRMIFNIGAKAIGTLNSSREGGVKNFLEDNRMPQTPEAYSEQTSFDYMVKHMDKVMARVQNDPAKKYALENWEAMRKCVSDRGAKVLHTYIKLKQRNKTPDVTRWAIREELDLN